MLTLCHLQDEPDEGNEGDEGDLDSSSDWEPQEEDGESDMDMDEGEDEERADTPIGVAATFKNDDSKLKEFVYEGDIYWGTLLPQEGTSKERHREIERANHALMIEAITTGSDHIPRDIATVVADYLQR